MCHPPSLLLTGDVASLRRLFASSATILVTSGFKPTVKNGTGLGRPPDQLRDMLARYNDSVLARRAVDHNALTVWV